MLLWILVYFSWKSFVLLYCYQTDRVCNLIIFKACALCIHYTLYKTHVHICNRLYTLALYKVVIRINLKPRSRLAFGFRSWHFLWQTEGHRWIYVNHAKSLHYVRLARVFRSAVDVLIYEHASQPQLTLRSVG